MKRGRPVQIEERCTDSERVFALHVYRGDTVHSLYRSHLLQTEHVAGFDIRAETIRWLMYDWRHYRRTIACPLPNGRVTSQRNLQLNGSRSR